MLLLERSTRELLGSLKSLRRGVSTPCGSRRRLQSCGADHYAMLRLSPDSSFALHSTAKPAGNYHVLQALKVSHHPLSRCVDRVAALQTVHSSAFNPWLRPGFSKHGILRSCRALCVGRDAIVTLLIACAEIGVGRTVHYGGCPEPCQ
jgi:hypothetical protein